MRKPFLFLLVLLSLFSRSVLAQTTSTGEREEALRCLKTGDISKAILIYASAIDVSKNSRKAGQGVDGDLVGEYAYALALNHHYEAALVNIDRCRHLSGKYQDFYTAQVLFVMGFKEAATEIGKGADIPSSLRSVYNDLNLRFAAQAHISNTIPNETLLRANELASKGQVIQAIALFEELISYSPEEPLLYVNESAIWETMGYFDHASELLKQGIQLTPKVSINQERIQSYQDHLNLLSTATTHPLQYSWLQPILGNEMPKLLLYGGAAYSSGLFSINARLGAYTNTQYSASLNTGISFSEQQVIGNIGISVYKTWKSFVFGVGLTDQFTRESNSISFSPSFGLSFPNKDRSSSFDVMMNILFPLSSSGSMSYSLSIGQTVYLDFKKKGK